MTPSLDEIADMIAGPSDARPIWLAHCLKRQVQRIALFREAEGRAPQRATIKAQLQAFRDAVVTVKEGMNDPTFMAFIGYDRSSFQISDREVEDALEMLSSAAHQAVLVLAGKPTVPVAFPKDDESAVSAQLLCAWTVRTVMQLVRNVRAIGADNPSAREAANALWQASGGSTLGSRDGMREATGWRHYFIEAKQADEPDDARSAWLAAERKMLRSMTPVGFQDSERP